MRALLIVPGVLLQAMHPADAHGSTLSPWPRLLQSEFWCPWCVGEHQPQANPFLTVNRETRPSSPCLGTYPGGESYTDYHYGPYKDRVRPPWEMYAPGQTFETRLILNADHGGDATWQLCKHSEAQTEDCFRQNQITPWSDVHSYWGTKSMIAHWKNDHDFPENVTLPSDLEHGSYTLRWFWVCKFTDEIFVSCIDINVGAQASGPPDPLPEPRVLEPYTTKPLNEWCPTPDQGNCLDSECCFNPEFKCFKANNGYAQCRESCPSNWNCEVLYSPPATPSPTTATPTEAPATTTMEASTDAPTTEAPTTEVPTTEAPTTQATTTKSPATEAPTTEEPTTTPPTTEAPTTEAPSTEAPTTQPPTTQPPTTQPPTTQPPTTETPTTETPTTEPPTTEPPTEAPTQAPTAPAPAPTNCAGKWGNCRSNRCCKNAGYTCYERNRWYSQCRPAGNCPSDWSCEVLGDRTPSPTPAPVPTACTTGEWGGCKDTKCCKDPGLKCYAKGDGYAQCRSSCPSSWSCTVLSSLMSINSSATILVESGQKKCAAKGESCQSTPCCGLACYMKDEWHAECKESCTEEDKASGWACALLSHTQHAMTCAAMQAQCGGNHWEGPTKCCDAKAKCERVDVNYHQCQPVGNLRQIRRHRAAQQQLSSASSALVQQDAETRPGAYAEEEVEEDDEKVVYEFGDEL